MKRFEVPIGITKSLSLLYCGRRYFDQMALTYFDLKRKKVICLPASEERKLSRTCPGSAGRQA